MSTIAPAFTGFCNGDAAALRSEDGQASVPVTFIAYVARGVVVQLAAPLLYTSAAANETPRLYALPAGHIITVPASAVARVSEPHTTTLQ